MQPHVTWLTIFCGRDNICDGDGGLVVLPGSHKVSFARPPELYGPFGGRARELGPDRSGYVPSYLALRLETKPQVQQRHVPVFCLLTVTQKAGGSRGSRSLQSKRWLG